MNKICTHCKQLKCFVYFAKDKYMKDGHKSWCRKCNLESMSSKDNGLHLKYTAMIHRCSPKRILAISEHYYLKGIRCEWKSYDDFKSDMEESYLEHFNTYGRKGTTIDRIDSNKNYCKENCRWVTHSQNGINREKTKNYTSSKYKGVCFRNAGKHLHWWCTIRKDNKIVHFRRFETEIEAARDYNVNVKKLHGKFAVLNKLPVKSKME